MPKKSLSLKNFSKGLNTESSPRDIEDENLARSVGVTIERPGILRPLGKANSLAGNSQYYRFSDDNDNPVEIDGIQDPGHGLYAFSYGFNYGERSAITAVTPDHDASSGNMTISISDSIGAEIDDVNITEGDIVRIYGKTASKELNNRYFEIALVNAANSRFNIKTIVDGSSKEFCTKDEADNRIAAAIFDTGVTITENLSVGEDGISVSSRTPFAKGDYIKIDSEIMKVISVDLDSNTDGLSVETGVAGSTEATHNSTASIYKYVHGVDHADLGVVEDGYIEIVPQRNYTKYIACQNGETIKLFVNDTTNNRNSTTKLIDNVIDLKDTFKGAGSSSSDTTQSVAASLGLDTLAYDNNDWPGEGVIPTYLFASGALRVSPSNKIGKDDTNYSPRWLGHIQRESMFGKNHSVTRLNEWYFDTIAPKRPVEQGSSHSTNERESYLLDVFNDYSKSNTLGAPQGCNWLSQFYLTGSTNHRQNPGIATIHNCNFWENDPDDDIEDEIENDDSGLEISGGIVDGLGNYDKDWLWESDGGENERWRIRQNLYNRSFKEITTLDEDIDLTEQRWNLNTDVSKYFKIGQQVKTGKMFGETGEEIVMVKFLPGDTQIDVQRATEGSVAATHSDDTKIYDASNIDYTRPTASGDLLINNGSSGGQGGAYTFSEPIEDPNVNGVVPWKGLSPITYEEHFGKRTCTLSYLSTSTPGTISTTSSKGHPQTIITRDKSLDNTNWIVYNGATIDRSSRASDVRHYSVAYNALRPGTSYYVTYTCRNFHSTNGGVLKLSLGQVNALSENADEYHIIDSNAYKTTVEIKSPELISDVNRNLVLCIQVEDSVDGGTDGTVGGSADGQRTMIGDLSVISKDKVWMTAKDFIRDENDNVSLETFQSWGDYINPLSSLAIGIQKYNVEAGLDSWGINSSAYDFYISYLYDGGQTPQESAPRFMKKFKVTERDDGTSDGIRISASLCYSSSGDVYDMFNKRIMGARVYFRESDAQEDEKLLAILDIDFVRGIRKATNADFVPWTEDYQNATEKKPQDGGNYSWESYNSSGPYKQVKPADEGSHEFGYFQFNSPPTALTYSTLNSSQPFEKGNFFAQYKTIAVLKGKAYIGNFSIRPTGLTNANKNSKSFEYYPTSILASEEGCYDKFPFESLWIDMPELDDDSPIVKLESFKDNLVVHKETSTFILNFKEENNPSLIGSLSAGGVKWKSQSISTNYGVFWANKHGCFHFDGEKISDLTIGKISKNSLGWPNNNSSLYYWNIEATDKKVPSLGYDSVNNQLLVLTNCRMSKLDDRDNQEDSHIWIYDLKSESWTSDFAANADKTKRFLAPLNQTGKGWRTNFVSEAGDKVIFIDNYAGVLANKTKYPITKWENKLYASSTVKDKRCLEFMTKELDFGNPHTRKRIFQIFVTYRMSYTVGDGTDGTVDTDVGFGTDGGTLTDNFDTGASDGFSSSFDNTNGDWAVATLVPSASIDCYTFQLKVSTEVSGSQSVVPFDFEINDITFVYRLKNIKTKVKT